MFVNQRNLSAGWRKLSGRSEGAMLKPLQIIERATVLIKDERHWCRGKLAKDQNDPRRDGFKRY
jgi:hypothetical protein